MMFWKRKGKTTPMLKAWENDALEFGIPEDTQKGLLFLIAFSSRLQQPQMGLEAYLRHFGKLTDKIRLKAPYISGKASGEFYSREIDSLLTELRERFLHKPGASPNLQRSKENRLPEQLGPDTHLLRDWEEITTSLCKQIGQNLPDNLEEAYLAGFVHFDRQHQLDYEGSMQVAQIATAFFPPHLQWFEHCLQFTPKQIRQGNPVQKTLDCFLDQRNRRLYAEVAVLSDGLHYCGPKQKRQEVWDASLLEYTLTASLAQTNLQEESGQAWLESLKEDLLKEGFRSPSVCDSEEEAVSLVGQEVAERWGYDVLKDEKPSCAGEEYTRRVCVTFLCVIYGILNPSWNAFARNRV